MLLPREMKKNESLRSMVKGYELAILKEAMARFKGNQYQIAKFLNTNRTTIIMKLQRYGLTRGQK